MENVEFASRFIRIITSAGRRFSPQEAPRTYDAEGFLSELLPADQEPTYSFVQPSPMPDSST